jgi:hypothetical protein
VTSHRPNRITDERAELEAAAELQAQLYRDYMIAQMEAANPGAVMPDLPPLVMMLLRSPPPPIKRVTLGGFILTAAGPQLTHDRLAEWAPDPAAKAGDAFFHLDVISPSDAYLTTLVLQHDRTFTRSEAVPLWTVEAVKLFARIFYLNGFTLWPLPEPTAVVVPLPPPTALRPPSASPSTPLMGPPQTLASTSTDRRRRFPSDNSSEVHPPFGFPVTLY